MEVLLSIPDDLVKYIEYIPDDVLPELLIDMVKRDILGRHDCNSRDEPSIKSQQDLSKIFELLQQAQDSSRFNTVQQTQQNSVNEFIETEIEEQETVILSQLNIQDTEEMGDLMDLLK